MAHAGFDAIVFDLDGVIVDTERPVFEAWRSVFASYGGELALEEWSVMVGTSGGGVAAYELLRRRAAVTLPALEEVRAAVREHQREQIAALTPLPGVRDWVVAAHRRGIALAVASSSSSNWVRSCLAVVQLDGYFETIVCPSERRAAKPAPDLYLAACEYLGARPRRSLAVEDSRNGVAAAVAAGLRCLAVPNSITAAMDLSAADHLVTSLAELDIDEAFGLLSPLREAP
jgi:HAD superfamily hydrolase (TIGR01509 family)